MTVALEFQACEKYTKFMRISWHVVSIYLFAQKILNAHQS